MIAFIRGTLIEYRADSAVIDVQGVGYEVNMHPRAIGSLPAVGLTVMVHTFLQATETEFRIYGFLDPSELTLFKLLLTVSGIGARGAMNVLATLEPTQFYHAIASQDEKALLRIPGVGRKSAQRMLFELKDKVGADIILTPAAGPADNSFGDVLAALESLGYARGEVYGDLLEMKNHGLLTGQTADNIKLVLKRKAQQLRR